MTRNESLFGIRFGSNEELYPAKEELKAFLASVKPDGSPHARDLEPYQKLLADYEAFEKRKNQSAETIDHRERMYYAVLGHSCFLNHAVPISVELYKYHIRFLETLEFKKPSAFIKAAEEELRTLDPKNKEQAARLTRLLDLTTERKAALDKMTGIWMKISDELMSIIVYLHDNLAKINLICRLSLNILKDEKTAKGEENRLTEDIKTQFKEQLKDSLHRGDITRQQIEVVQQDVTKLLQETSSFVYKDIDALKKLYQALVDHTGRVISGLNSMIKQFRGSTARIFDDELNIFCRAEKLLVSLVADARFDMYASVTKSETPYLNILAEKRVEMFEHIIELLKKDRRSVSDRRIASDRRKFKDPGYKGPERRSGKDRRSERSRRKP